MRASEYVAATAFLYFAVVCWFGKVQLPRRLLVTAVSLGLLLVVRLVSASGVMVRDWAPALFILAGYYVSGMVYVRPSERLERWLLGWDHRLLDDPTTRFSNWPPLLLAYLDLVYTVCFALLPAGLAILLVTGQGHDVDRYWTLVSIAELGAFMPLAFIQTRPPWVIERRAGLPDGAVRHMAEQAVRRVSHGVNTFPSGHASGSVAISLALSRTSPVAALVFFVLAASISLACVVGRYHYIVDVVAGVILALTVWAVTLSVGI